MSGLLNTLHDLHQQHRERREERREVRDERRGHGGYHNDQDNYGSQHHHQRTYQGEDDDDSRRPQAYRDQSQGQGYGYQGDDDARRPQSYQNQYQGQAYGYVPPSGPPPSTRGPSGFSSQGGIDRGDFASDADIDRMVAAGEFNQRRGPRGDEYGRGADLERHNAYGRHDTPNVPQQSQGYGEPANEYRSYDQPSGPPPGQGYRGQESYQQSYGSGYGGGPDRSSQYGPPQGQGRGQYDAPQRPPQGYGSDQGNAPVGEYGASRPAEQRYGSGYGGPTNDRPYRSEASGYYNQQGAPGGDDRYTHLANMAEAHGDDPELYRRATQGLHEKIQTQTQSRPTRRDNEDDDYKTHVDAHRKAYGDEDHGPMDANTIGSAAAMEAIKQTVAAAKSSNAPAGALKATGSKPSGGSSPKPAQAAQEEAGETAAAGAGAGAGVGAGGGLQDKLMALAMSQAGKLFDKKNAGLPSGGAQSQDKAQAMQSAAATAMQLFQQYQTKGKLDAGDMSKVMGLAMNFMK